MSSAVIDQLKIGRVVFAGCLYILFFGTPGSTAQHSLAGEVEQTEQLLDGLRSRRLFDLAESYCERQLQRANLTPQLEVTLNTELMETLALHALYAQGERQLELFAKAEQVAVDFRRDHRDHVQAEMVDVQEAFLYLTKGVFNRQQSQLSTASTEKKEQARKAFSLAIRILEALQKKIDLELPLRRSRHKDGQLTADELFALRNNLSLHLARASRELAVTYPVRSDDWLAALALAADHLQDPLTKLPPEDPLTSQLWLEKARIDRISGNFKDAGESLEQSQPTSLPGEQEKKIEAVKLALATAQLDTAEKLLDASLLKARGEAAVMKLELLLLKSDAERRSDDALAKKWRSMATQLVGEIEQLHGNYWGRIAEQQLLASVGSGDTADLDLMARSADDLFRKKQYEQAVAAYELAAEQAVVQNAIAAAMLMKMRAAAVLQSQNKHVAAATTLSGAATRFPKDARAPQAQLMAAWNLAKVLPEQPDLLRQYESALTDARKNWPDAETTLQARVWLIRLRSGQAKWQDVIEIGLELPRENPLWRQVSPLVDKALGGLLAGVNEDEREETAAKLASQLAQALPATESADRWADGDAELAIMAAKMYVVAGVKQFRAAEQLLNAAGTRLPALSDFWQTEAAVAQLIVDAANTATNISASDRVKSLNLQSRAKLWQLASRLKSVREVESAGVIAVAKLELAAIDLIRSSEQTNDNFTSDWKLDLAEADALAAAEDRDKASQLYEQILKDQPNLSQPQTAYARFLATGDTKSEIESALSRWRVIAARTPPQTEAWYEAKHEVARMLIRLGDKRRAGDVIRFLRVGDDNLNNSVWSKKFDELLRFAE
jgi:hypothetical protein